MSHYGILHTISTYSDLAKHLEDMQRHLDMLQGDGSWMGVSILSTRTGMSKLTPVPQSPLQARTEQAINTVKVRLFPLQSQRIHSHL
jgi:ubiquitin conjugation factor E4 B